MPTSIAPRRFKRTALSVPLFVPFELDKDGRIPPSAAANIQEVLLAITNRFKGNMDLGDGENGFAPGVLAANVREVYFLLADTEVTIPHGLGKVPIGYWVIRKSQACNIYDANAGSWDTNWMGLQCSVALSTVSLIIF